MSGIAGIVGVPRAVDVRPLAAMLRALDARGPDGRAESVLAAGALGVTLLAGSPPGGDAGGRWTVVTDGEWLNVVPLQKELVARGYACAGSNEVAGTVFAELGFERGMARLRGNVAIAAWDSVERRLWLARDRTGQRPLVWTRLADGSFLFASEARALLAHPGVARRADPTAIEALVLFGALPSPRTPWRDIQRVGAGCAVRVDAEGVRELRYWTHTAHPDGAHGDRARWALSARYAFELAARQRVGDEGVAVAASGGVFARAVLGAARERRADALALSLDFGESAEGERIAVPDGEITGILAEMAASLDEPAVDPTTLGWWMLGRTAWARGCRTLLTGVGGAELFGGRPPGAAGMVARLLKTQGFRRRAVRERCELRQGEGSESAWAEIDALAASCPTSDPMSASMWLDRHVWIADGGNRDQATAAHGVTLHAPLTDPDLVTLVTGIPVGLMAGMRAPRALFLQALSERLGGDPPPPRPMAPPVDAWLRQGLCGGLAEALEGLADPDGVRRLVADFEGGASGVSRRLWALVAVARWRAAGWA